MRFRNFALVICAAGWALGPAGATAHETDQYSVPSGRAYADLRYYFSDEFRSAISAAVRQTNRRIEASLRDGRPTPRTQALQSPDVIALAVLWQFPPVIYHVEALEMALNSSDLRRRYPGLLVKYQPFVWIYDHFMMLLDPTKLIRIRRCSTVMIDGTYLGTDKVVHFVHMGYIYFRHYRAALRRGHSEEEAVARMIGLGTGLHPLSESSLLGMLSTGVRSNADLAADYAGYKFYRNLTEPVRLKGRMHPPLLVREGPYWRLNHHLRPRADFFSAYVSDHWDEALNPGLYEFHLQMWLPGEIRKRCDDILRWYVDREGRRRTRDDFLAILEQMRTYFGEDYGHAGEPEDLISIASCCFDELAEADALARRAGQGERGTHGRGLGHWMGDDVTVARDGNPGASNEVDRLGRTALWWAAADGRTKNLERLISHGCAVDAGDLDGDTPLHAAVRWGRVDAVRLLLEAGANANAPGRYGMTPLHRAVRTADLRTFTLLLSQGGDAGAADVFGRTPLHDAAGRGDEWMTKRLLETGADPYGRDRSDVTPLHLAARGGHVNTVELLLEAGADPSVVNRSGLTPVDEARRSGHRAVMERLGFALRERERAGSGP